MRITRFLSLGLARGASAACVAAAVVVLCWPLAARSESIDISQLDLNLADGSHPNSDWGEANLTFTGTASVEYLNLSVLMGNTAVWEAQNVPILSVAGVGVTQTQQIDFPLTTNGTPVSTVSFGETLTTTPVDMAPPVTQLNQPVGHTTVNMSSDEGFVPITYTPAVALIGSAAVASVTVKPGFPNQVQGPNECVPAAISNSLMYLNTVLGLNLNPADLTIAKMKTATGWTAGGAPLGWWDTKDQYMRANGLPFTTTTSASITDAINALQMMCDVEMGGGGHRAAVVGITSLANGQYTIDVAHDTQQNNLPGGTKIQPVDYDPTTGMLTGAPGFNNVALRNFVIECVPEPSSVVMGATAALAGLGYTWRRRARAVA